MNDTHGAAFENRRRAMTEAEMIQFFICPRGSLGHFFGSFVFVALDLGLKCLRKIVFHLCAELQNFPQLLHRIEYIIRVVLGMNMRGTESRAAVDSRVCFFSPHPSAISFNEHNVLNVGTIIKKRDKIEKYVEFSHVSRIKNI